MGLLKARARIPVENQPRAYYLYPRLGLLGRIRKYIAFGPQFLESAIPYLPESILNREPFENSREKLNSRLANKGFDADLGEGFGINSLSSQVSYKGENIATLYLQRSEQPNSKYGLLKDDAYLALGANESVLNDTIDLSVIETFNMAVTAYFIPVLIEVK